VVFIEKKIVTPTTVLTPQCLLKHYQTEPVDLSVSETYTYTNFVSPCILIH